MGIVWYPGKKNVIDYETFHFVNSYIRADFGCEQCLFAEYPVDAEDGKQYYFSGL